MVLAVCLNPGPDKLYEAPGFTLTGARRPSRTLTCVGGKGVNAARVLHRLGHEVTILGISAGHAGRYMEDSLADEGLRHRMIRAEGESRLAITIMDSAAGVHTEVNEPGPEVAVEVIELALAAFEELLPSHQYCVISGSAPPGTRDDIYATMVAMCHTAGVPVLLDANRAWLLGAAKSKPSVLKPNEAELGTLLGREVNGTVDAAQSAIELLDPGMDAILVTLGEEGALGVTDDEILHARLSQPVEAVSPVASGDAFAAGYVAGVLEGGELQDNLSLAVACGTANAEVFGPGYITRARAEELLALIRIAPLRVDP